MIAVADLIGRHLRLIDIKQRQRQHPSSGVALGPIGWCALAHRRPTVIEARMDPGTYTETLQTIRG